MDDQNMADYNLPGSLKTAAHEPAPSDQNHLNRPHAHHHAHDHHSRKNRHRDSGAQAMNKLANALGRTTLKDDNSKQKNGETSHKSQVGQPHTHHHAHDLHNKRKKGRGSGAVAMNQLANALAKSNLRDDDDDDSKHKNGKKLTKRQRKKQRSREAQAQRADSAGRDKVLRPDGQEHNTRDSQHERDASAFIQWRVPHQGARIQDGHE